MWVTRVQGVSTASTQSSRCWARVRPTPTVLLVLPIPPLGLITATVYGVAGDFCACSASVAWCRLALLRTDAIVMGR